MMKSVSKYKVELGIVIPLILFFIISILTIYSAGNIIPSTMGNIALKQTLWYIVGFAIAYFIMYIGVDYLLKYAWFLYGTGVLSLVLLLFIGTPINDARCWFAIGNIATIQPSEFMKVFLILALAKVIDEFNTSNSKPTLKEEFYLLIKVFIIAAIPSVLTFLQPDTGIVIIYFFITMTMLLISGIRYRWFVIIFSIILSIGGIFLSLYFFKSDLFINIFGTNFFYRVDRLLDWQSGDGMQLGNAMTAIGSSGLFGFGLKGTPIYFPEAHTDFIFSVYASNFGLIGSTFLIGLLTFFDLKIITIGLKSNQNSNKYIIAGITGMLLYQQVQSIGMNIGLLPITGITLPFISYGGSSLLSYMIIAGIIFNLSNQTLRFWNIKK
ncbi:MAG: FtsW/RodA/SpoVE family cell cycle protein [Bacilli bacterium]|nr:FtsW/RodA/SpoVE family cell cycle protein [Bacilli bacterium]MDD4298179.1 FtsW/RodA/SpoVE family cell cycle protein [Bacilli bacterium]MDD4643425.1 FtsW/RodA/SpoVE family cell cycle protein [Bacilli bacterium]